MLFGVLSVVEVADVSGGGLVGLAGVLDVAEAAGGGAGVDAGPEFLFDPVLDFLDDFVVLLGLQALGLLIEYLNLLNLVVCDPEFVFKMRVLVLEHFSLLDDSFSLDLVFLLVDFVVEPALLQRQHRQASFYLLHFLLLYLYFLLKLQLRVEQLIVHPFQPYRCVLDRTRRCRIRVFKRCDSSAELLDQFGVSALLQKDKVLKAQEGTAAGVEVALGQLRMFGEAVFVPVEFFEEEGEVFNQTRLHHLDDVH